MIRRAVGISLITLFIISGCVYYNTFFNAEKYFTEAQKIRLKDDGKPTTNAIQKYNKAIKKCGIVLTDYKDSKYADDALFLLAKSLFYIGRNYTQAIEKFNDLIKFYPESEFIPEAKIYTGRANYEFGKKQEAYELLQEFLLVEEFQEYHPEALQQLANYHLEDKDYIQSDFYLQKLIEKYPKSDEYENAFFLQGKTQNEAGNYIKSNEVFFSLLKSKVSRKLKFDARYYIALNHLLLEEYQKAAKKADKLLKDEYRESKISKIHLIKARSLAGLDKTEQAIELFNTIINDNKRTKISAESSYYLAELYFNILRDYQKAIEFYNNVKKEYNKSEFIESSLSRSAVASQIIQYYNPDHTITIEELVEQQFKLAEFYIEVLDMPDSAIMVYDNIINQRENLILKLDSLNIIADSIAIEIDSLLVYDSLLISQETKIDSISIEKEKKEKDTTKVKLQADFNNITYQIEKYQQNLIQYNEEFIPFAKFVKIWIYKTSLNDSLKADEVYQDLKSNNPEHKYTYAASQFLSGNEAKLTTIKQIKELEEYQNAINEYENNPLKAIKLLKSIAEDNNHEFTDKAFYSLGYINYFLLADSIAAKPYLDTLLSKENIREFKESIAKFYDGKYFKKLTRLPYIDQLEKAKKEKEKKEELSEEPEKLHPEKKEYKKEEPEKEPEIEKPLKP